MNNMVMSFGHRLQPEPEIGKSVFCSFILKWTDGKFVSAWFDVSQEAIYQRVLPEHLRIREHFFMLQSVIMDESERFQQEDLF